ncbi:MAG: nucleotidyltransferase domain-containing protein [Bacilli bacterium]|jgi:hypothetical protein
MNVSNKLSVLKKIANELNKMNVTWAIGASMLLYFKGILLDFNDIDIMVANEDIEQVRKTLMKMGTLQLPNPNSKYETKVFLEFIIDGVDVDVMAGFTIVNNGSLIDCSLKNEEIVEFYDLEGVKIPLQSVEIWCKYYELMGRKDRVNMIKNFYLKANVTEKGDKCAKFKIKEKGKDK